MMQQVHFLDSLILIFLNIFYLTCTSLRSLKCFFICTCSIFFKPSLICEDVVKWIISLHFNMVIDLKNCLLISFFGCFSIKLEKYWDSWFHFSLIHWFMVSLTERCKCFWMGWDRTGQGTGDRTYPAYLALLSTTRQIYKRLFCLTSSNTVNKGQLRSIKVN